MVLNDSNNSIRLPMIALRGLVVFPGMLLHFDVGRQKSILALEKAMEKDRTVFLLTQRDMREEEPDDSGLYVTGCIARIRQLVKLTPEAVRVVVEGQSRASYINIDRSGDVSFADVAVESDTVSRAGAAKREALVRRVRSKFEEYAELCPKLSPDIAMSVLQINECGALADYIASNTPLPLDDRQYVLETLNPVNRLSLVIQILGREVEILTLDARIADRIKDQMNDNQRSYYLREQLRAISTELYGEEDPDEEADEYRRKIDCLKAGEEIKDKLFKEVDKLVKMPPGSHEGTVVRGYLDACIELPWGVYSTDKTDIARSRKILDRDHYGMEKVKERILELLAVRVLAPDIKGQIVCLVGPPGVGKTSIAKAVAECMGRKYERIALGGVHDEAEIRGHRRTYIGAMPGRIISAVSRAGTSNPLILLDEVDKLADDIHGDPSSALLEVLDAEQNATFTDHFIDLPFDLSRVMFITTANTSETIPNPLLDRMEIIELPSYTTEEKFHIAKDHLIKRALKKHGLKASDLRFGDAAIYSMIEEYTREGGVRQLEREISAVCRKCAVAKVSGNTKRLNVTPGSLNGLLGTPKYKRENTGKLDTIGLVNGLAFTSVGGETLQIEAAAVPGTGKIVTTGSLGDVMRESAETAVSYIKTQAGILGVDPDFYKNKDIHIHATQAAVPKDGPSAGVTIVTAVVSALKRVPVRNDIAMTGEVTLLGRVLPIGGLREKTMAAYRAGLKTVFIPSENLPDLDEIDRTVRSSLKFVPVDNVSDILSAALIPETPPVDSAIFAEIPDRGQVKRSELQ